jgi:uncharacterized protein (TIGR00730 family)
VVQHIAVFCGSKTGVNPKYLESTLALGALLGANKKHVIYGGGNVGLMGAIANSTLQHGGTVTGIIPGFLNSVERQHQHLTHLIETETMHERKKLLFEKSDMAIILPGGYGTLDELFEMLTWNQLELHKIKVIIFNVDGFYNHLKNHINFIFKQQFLYGNPEEEIHFIESAAALQPYF